MTVITTLITMIGMVPAVAQEAAKATPPGEPVRYEFKAGSVWGNVRVHVTDRGSSFKASVTSDAPLEGWRLLRGRSPEPVAKGRLNRAFKFQVEQGTALEGDLRLVLLVASETGTQTLSVKLAKSGAVTGKDSTLEPALAYQEDPDRPYHAMVKNLYDQAAGDYREKKYEAARQALEKALDLDPGNRQVKKLLGRVEREEAGGKNAALVKKAQKQWDDGETEFALETLEGVLKADPKSRPAADLKGKILNSESVRNQEGLKRALASARKAEAQGDLVAAERQYRGALELDPENEKAANGLRRVTSGAPRKQAAAPAAREEPEEKAQKADRAYNLGLDCYRKGDLEGARKFWEETLEYQPGHFQAKRNLDRLAKTEKKP